VINPPTTMKIIYWTATGIILFLLSWSFVFYHLLYDRAAGFFEAFGYPTYLVYPLAYLKLVAILVIVTHRYNDLRDMVYAAYFVNMIIALVGHIVYGDFFGHAIIGAIALVVSYLLGNNVRGLPSKDFFGRFTHSDVCRSRR